jgi:hypothetical protein
MQPSDVRNTFVRGDSQRVRTSGRCLSNAHSLTDHVKLVAGFETGNYIHRLSLIAPTLFVEKRKRLAGGHESVPRSHRLDERALNNDSRFTGCYRLNVVADGLA